MKEERDRIGAELEQHLESEQSWHSKHAALEAEHKSVKNSLEICESEKTTLSHDKDALQSEVHSIQADITLLQDKLTQGALELASQTRQLQSVQSELKSAKRRAEEAERIQTELQSEGTDLMRSLEEMRPKIVELTGAKLELSEKVSGLESEVRARDAVISNLEVELDEHRELKEEAERRLNDNASLYQKERLAEKSAAKTLQAAQAELMEELETALATIQTLDKERSLQHQEAERRLQEMERLSQSAAIQDDRIAALREEADERNDIQVSEGLLCVCRTLINYPSLSRVRNRSTSCKPRAKSRVFGKPSKAETRRLSVCAWQRPSTKPRRLWTTRC